VLGIVDDLPGPFGTGTCHHVEVVHVVSGCGDRWSVIAVRNEHDVTAADLFEHLDRALRGAVHAVIAEASGIAWAGGDLEVVDLLERRLDRRLLVVLVRRVARPVAARRDHLAGDQ
jgi:hypothetical protein